MIDQLRKLPRPTWPAIAAAATSSLFICGAMYLWGYWRYFGINFLDWMSLDEIVARSLFNIIPTGFLFAQIVILSLLPAMSRKFRAWVARAKAEREASKSIWSRAEFALPFLSLILFLGFVAIFGLVGGDPTYGLMMGAPALLAAIGCIFLPHFVRALPTEE